MSNDLTAALTDEQVFDLIAGSGFSQYPWYTGLSVDWEGRRAEIVMDNGHGGVESATLTVGSLRRAINGAAFNDEIKAVPLAADWTDPDFDADMADCVIQYAVLGDVIFG